MCTCAEKMRSGTPLTDEDRLPWLQTLANLLERHATRGERCVLACSALKESYRAILSGQDPYADAIAFVS